jgi:poly(3-hydroxybutyrate) depolymerase
MRTAFVLLAFVIGCRRSSIPDSNEGKQAELATKNDIGRSGAYYVPAHPERGPLPLVVALHGTNGAGGSMVGSLRPLADANRFIVVAPDSRRSPSGGLTWEVADRRDEVTPDYTHVMRCIEEMRTLPGVKIDEAHVLVLGYSGGGSMAPYLASRESLFEAFAVLHGGAFASGMGDFRPRGWFSTGASDPLRPEKMVRDHLEAVHALGFEGLQLRVYPGGHEISERELREVIDWWLHE